MKKKRLKFVFLITQFLLISSGCMSRLPESFIRTYNEPAVWKSFEVRQELEKDSIWRFVVDAITQKYDLEVIEKESGYLRTSWKFTYIDNNVFRTGGVSDRYRSRIILKFKGKAWEVLQVKCESHWLDKRRSSWIVGYDSLLLEDVYADLQGRIGRVVR